MSQFYEKNELKKFPDFIANIKKYAEDTSGFKIGKYVISVADEPKFVFMRYFDFTNMYEKLEEMDEVSAAVPHSITQGEQILLKIKSRFDFLSGLSNGDILQVVQDVKILSYNQGEIIFEQGQSGEEVYFIISGKVAISISTEKDMVKQKIAKRVNVAVLPQMTIFGEMGPITRELRSARATAADKTSLLSFKIRSNENETTMKAFLKLKQNFIEILAKKLIETNKKLFSKS